MDLTTNLPGLKLKNPVLPASGTCGYGKEFEEFYDLNILGGIITKSLTKEERFGNPLPRIAEGKMGTLNCIGLQNPGLDHVADIEIPYLINNYPDLPLIVSIAGDKTQDYIDCINRLNKINGINAYEINISCPNVSNGGCALSSDPLLAYEITKEIKKVSKKPIYMKLTPLVNDITKVALSCEKAGADGLVLANSYQGMRIDLKTGKPILSRKIGGLGGPAIFPQALKVVYTCAKVVKIPIIGVGGISTASDVLEFLLAGASAVEIGSANLHDPFTCKKIIEELPKVLKQYNKKSVKECIKGALKYE